MRVLVLSPHTDDGEFGCGGTIARQVAEGHKVHIVAFSNCGDPELSAEALAAAEALGVSSPQVFLFDFPARDFPSCRQAILEVMITLSTNLRPDTVFLPCSADTHQDHQVVRQEGFRAFKKTTILGYELPWNNIDFSAQLFVRLSEKHLKKKHHALLCYKSQKDRYYASPVSIGALACVRGTQIGEECAEAFEVIRWVM